MTFKDVVIFVVLFALFFVGVKRGICREYVGCGLFCPYSLSLEFSEASMCAYRVGQSGMDVHNVWVICIVSMFMCVLYGFHCGFMHITKEWWQQ